MKNNLIKTLVFFSTLSSYSFFPAQNNEYYKLQKLELQILKKNTVGKSYKFDLTRKKGCNKTELKYLGIVTTNSGKKYKILNSFFVFGTNGDICHGTSSIKFYDLKNRYVGKYDAGMPDNLPNSLKNSKLVYLKNDECPRKNKHSINLSNGLPKTFFVEYTNGLGDEYIFE